MALSPGVEIRPVGVDFEDLGKELRQVLSYGPQSAGVIDGLIGIIGYWIGSCHGKDLYAIRIRNVRMANRRR